MLWRGNIEEGSGYGSRGTEVAVLEMDNGEGMVGEGYRNGGGLG